jgi:hypothetical protein
VVDDESRLWMASYVTKEWTHQEMTLCSHQSSAAWQKKIEMVRSAFRNPSIPLSLTRTNIQSAMTKNPSLLRHTSFRTFGFVKRAPFWCLIYEGCLKTYVLISKQYYVVCVYVEEE